ncbi:hypothetical protein [Enterovibrio coralii]|uniref:hypothetical protein n=1 Tax=Enterovibrio coralii TaxID=294935 RepID=UPI000B2386E1|nr:hypothetical protein [Enterovibrio coralii]
MATLLGMSLGNLRHCEQGRKKLKAAHLVTITNHALFKKYTFWLMTGEVLPESGQVSPDFSILFELGIVAGRKSTQVLAQSSVSKCIIAGVMYGALWGIRFLFELRTGSNVHEKAGRGAIG